MRNALLISSLLFIAVSCKRDEDRAMRDRTAMEDTTGSRVGAGDTTTPDQPTRPAPDTTGGTGTSGTPATPDTAQPGTGTTGDMGTTGGAQPGGTQPGGTQPGAAQPGAAQPGAAQPGAAQPGAAQPGGAQPGGTTGGTAGTGTTGDMGTTGGTAGAGDAGQQPGGTAGAGQQPGGTAPSMAAMTCDQLIPSTVRDQYLRDAKITSTGAAGSNVANCRAEGGDLTSAVNITADCATTGARSPSDIRRQNPSGRPVENVGKAAVLTETGSTKQLTALDDDSNCRIDVSVPQNVDAVAIGRAMLDKLPGKG